MAHYCKEVYTNILCLELKEELIKSVGDSYIPNKVYITNVRGKNLKWYINTKGYVHFLTGKNETDVLLNNNYTIRYRY